MFQIHEVSLCEQLEPEEPLDLVEACQLLEQGIYLQGEPNTLLEPIEYFYPECSEPKLTSDPDLEHDDLSLSQMLEDTELLNNEQELEVSE